MSLYSDYMEASAAVEAAFSNSSATPASTAYTSPLWKNAERSSGDAKRKDRWTVKAQQDELRHADVGWDNVNQKVGDFFNETDDILSLYNKSIEREGYRSASNAENAYKGIADRAEAANRESLKIQGWLRDEFNEGRLDEETYQSYTKYLQEAAAQNVDLIQATRQATKYWGQFDNEDDWKVKTGNDQTGQDVKKWQEDHTYVSPYRQQAQDVFGLGPEYDSLMRSAERDEIQNGFSLSLQGRRELQDQLADLQEEMREAERQRKQNTSLTGDYLTDATRARPAEEIQKDIDEVQYRIGIAQTADMLRLQELAKDDPELAGLMEKARQSVFSYDDAGRQSAWQSVLNYVSPGAADLYDIPENPNTGKMSISFDDRTIWEQQGPSLADYSYAGAALSGMNDAMEGRGQPDSLYGLQLGSWTEPITENAAAARQLAEQFGISTNMIDDSLTRINEETYADRYAGKSFGQKMLSNLAITAGNYGLDIANAAMTAADALWGGELGSKAGQDPSLFRANNYAQNAGSGMMNVAYSSMRDNVNWLGKLVLDVERTTVEQLMDRALGGGRSLAMMGLRVFGSGAQEAENRGEDLWQQVKTGAARAGVELGTELMSGVGGSWRGTGYGDAFFGKLDRWVSSKTGSELLGTLASAFTSEAIEEMVSDVMNPVVDRLFGIGEVTGRGEDKTFMQKLGHFAEDVWGDGQILYDGLLGGLAGMGGGTVTHIAYGREAKALATDVATFKAAQRIAEDSRLKAQFEEYTGVKLAEDSETAIRQIGTMLTGIGDMTSKDARTAETEASRGMTLDEATRQGLQLGTWGENAERESTSVDTNPADHTAAEQEVIRAYQAAVDENLAQYIRDVQNGKKSDRERFTLKDISNRAADEILRITGIDTRGSKTQLEPRIVRHIIKDHGQNGKTDHTMADINDMARIQYVLDNFDSAEDGGTSSAYVTVKENGKHANAQTVIFSKKVNGTYFVVEAVPDTSTKTVYVASAYMKNEKAAPSSADANAPRNTSENAATNTAESTIPSPAAGVNTGAGVTETGAEPGLTLPAPIGETEITETGGSSYGTNAQESEGVLGQEAPQQAAGEAPAGADQAGTAGADTTAGPAAAGRPGGAVPDGDGGRDAGAGTGEPAGRVDRGTEQGTAGTGQRGKALARQNLGNALWGRKVVRDQSAKDLGVRNGTDATTLRVIPEDYWDEEMQETADRIATRTGLPVTFVQGPIMIRTKLGFERSVNGVVLSGNGGIIIRVDHFQYSVTQIGMHEEFHALIRLYPQLLEEVRRRLVADHSRAQIESALGMYIANYRGIIDTPKGADLESTDAAAMKIIEELCGDIYASMDKLGQNIRQFSDTVQGIVNDRIDAQRQSNGTRETRGPPAESGEESMPDETEKTDDFAMDFGEDERNKNLLLALDMAKHGATAGTIYTKTGLTMMANGNIIDPTTGEIIGRAERGTVGISEESTAGSKGSGKTQPAVSSYDRRGANRLFREAGREDGEQRKWEDLGREEQERVSQLIINHAENNPHDLTEGLINALGRDEIVRRVYDSFYQGNIVFETEARNYFSNVDELIDKLSTELTDDFSMDFGEDENQTLAQRNDPAYNEAVKPYLEEHHWSDTAPDTMVNTNLAGLKKDKALHQAAKKGDRNAADQIVARVTKPERMRQFAEDYKGALVVPVWSEDAEDGNMLPFAYADRLADYGFIICDQIVQIQKGGHTTANRTQRLLQHSVFEGEVIPGQTYVLVDDVMTLGGTMNDLRVYIESKGGRVVATTALAAGRSGTRLAPRQETIDALYAKHGKEEINTLLREAGIAYDAESLTEGQARYIRDVDHDTLRDRINEEKIPREHQRGTSDSRRETSERAGEAEPEVSEPFTDDVELTDDYSMDFDSAVLGNEGVTYVNDTEPVKFRWAVVSAEDLITSNDAAGNVNPTYPAELQPRARDRAASQLKVQKISQNLNPAVLAESPSAQNGAPIVRADGVVVGGNGRVMAITDAYGKDRAQHYADYIRENAERFGLDPENIPEHPVLVRVAEDTADWTQLARDLNTSTMESYSATERAMTDAAKIDERILDMLQPDDNGNINTPANQAFIQAFVQNVIPVNEQNTAITESGLLSQEGLERVEYALFARAYGDAALMQRLGESLDNDMKNVTNALLDIAPRVVQMQNAVDNGSMYDVRLRDHILGAVRLYHAAKQAGRTVAEQTANHSLEETYNDEMIYLARWIEQNKRSAKKIRELMNALFDTVEAYGDPNQLNIFGEEESHDFRQALEGAIERYERETGAELPRPDSWGAGEYEAADRGDEAAPAADAVPAGADQGDGTGGGTERGTGEPGLTLEAPIGETPAAAETEAEEEEISPEDLQRQRDLERKAKQIEKSRKRKERKQRKTDRRRLPPEYDPLKPYEAESDPVKAFIEAAKARAAAAKAERMAQVDKRSFTATPALQKLGVRIENSIGIYARVDQLLARERAARQLKKTIRNREAALKATAREKQFAAGLAAGIYSEQDIPPSMNRAKISELADYYWAEKSIASDMIKQRRRDINDVLDEQMEVLLKDSDLYKTPPMVVLNYRTPERICRTIWGDEHGRTVYNAVFRPVSVNEAEKIRFINRMFNEVRTFEDSTGKRSELTREESMLAQQVLEGRAVGELVASLEMGDSIIAAAENIRNGEDPADAAREFGLTDEENGIAQQYARWTITREIYESGQFDSTKIDNAVRTYSEMYDKMYDAINDFLVAHGYEPIGFIRGYAPHMQMKEDLNLFAGYLQSLGFNQDVTRLPASIAGVTAGFKPNKRWNPYFLQRNGDMTDYDIAKGFQSYVNYLSDVLYHTDDIMRIRAMSRFYRRTFSPDEVRERLSWIHENRGATVEMKEDRLKDDGFIARDSRLSEAEINEAWDRWTDQEYEKTDNMTKYSDYVMYLDNYANILAGKQSGIDRGAEQLLGRESLNFGNRLVNAFQRTQVAGAISSALNQTAQWPQIRAELGMKYTLKALTDFATGRTRAAGWAQESDFLTGKQGVDMLVTDRFDMVMEKLFMPLTQVDNLMSTIAVRGKYLMEVERGASHEEAMRAADEFGRSVMGSRVKGEKPVGFQSKRTIVQMANMFQIEALNSWEHLSQDLPADFRAIEKEKGTKAAAGALAAVIVKMLVSAFVINRLGEELYGGTPAPFDILGLSANFIASGQGLTTNRWLKKVMDDGMEKVLGDRRFGTDPDEGNEVFDWRAAAEDVGYNISNDIPFIRNLAGILGLGDQSLPLPLMGAGKDLKYLWQDIGNGRWDQAGMDALRLGMQVFPGGRQITKTAEGARLMLNGGQVLNDRLYYPVESTPGNWMKALLFGKSAMEESDAYYAAGRSPLSTDQTNAYRELVKRGAERTDLYETMQEYRAIDADEDLGSVERGRQLRDTITKADLTDEERLILFRGMDKGNAGRADDFEEIMETGLSWKDTARAYDRWAELNADEEMSKREKAESYAAWVERQGFGDEETAAVRDHFKFWQSIPIDETKVDKYVGAGFDADAAEELQQTLDSLTPLPGRDNVTDLQKYQAIAESRLSVDEQWDAIRATTPETYTSTLLKIDIMQEQGIQPATWSAAKQAIYDEDDAGDNNDNTSQKEATAALEKMDIPTWQKAVIWQTTNSSWKAKGNPFDRSVGQAIYDRMHEEPAEEATGTEPGLTLGSAWSGSAANTPSAYSGGESRGLPGLTLGTW